jgi:hypothetical protein
MTGLTDSFGFWHVGRGRYPKGYGMKKDFLRANSLKAREDFDIVHILRIQDKRQTLRRHLWRAHDAAFPDFSG